MGPEFTSDMIRRDRSSAGEMIRRDRSSAGEMSPEELEDHVAGALMGVIIGDAVGAPHEFRHGPRYEDGVISTLTVRSQYHRDRVAVRGQVTDDSEMTWALVRCLISEAGYDREKVIKAYIAWANGLAVDPIGANGLAVDPIGANGLAVDPIGAPGLAVDPIGAPGRPRGPSKKCYPPPPFMGNNTRRLFQGLRTVKGYLGRVGARPSAESNGCMMRSIPLLFFPEEDLEADVRITNDNETCVDACLILRDIFRGLLLGKDFRDLVEISSQGRDPRVVRALKAGIEGRPWDLVSSKGWVGHPLYLLGKVLDEFGPTVKAMRATLVDVNLTHRGCDSDTIGAIVLGVLGGVVGRERLLKSSFFRRAYEIVVTADSTKGDLARPAHYQPSGKGLGSRGISFDELVEGLTDVIGEDFEDA